MLDAAVAEVISKLVSNPKFSDLICGKAAVGENYNSTRDNDKVWKEDLEKSLFENYGFIPKYYEDFGDGIYQVYEFAKSLD